MRSLLPWLLAAACLASAVAGSGCHRKPRPRAKVITSIFPVYDLTRRIAGPDADVILLPPIEESPHKYTPTPADVERTQGANLAVMIGLDLDPWMEPLMTAHGAPKARILRLADRVPTLPRKPALANETGEANREATARPTQPRPDLANDPTRHPDGIDVHVWLDPQRALLMERAISDELSRVDPDHAKDFRTRSLEVTHSLEALDEELEKRTRDWKSRTFGTLHDAFRYYASRYHFDVAVAVEAQPGVRPPIRYEQMALGRMREKKATAMFGEPQLDSQPAKTVARAGPFTYGVLDPLGGSPGVESYEALLRADTDALERALLSPPPTPPAADAGGDAAPNKPAP